MSALIISGGDYAPCEGNPCDWVAACDKGHLYAEQMGIRPDLILGDFDSAPCRRSTTFVMVMACKL